MIRAILVSRCQPVAFSFLKVFVSVPSSFSGLGVLQVRVLAGSRAPLSVQAVVFLTFAELFENRCLFACRYLRIRGTGRDLWQDLHENTFDAVQVSFSLEFSNQGHEKR